jgi:general secretion pathway protein L
VRHFLSSEWRPVRWGIAAMLLLQLAGLNLWAAHLRGQLSERRLAMTAVLHEAFPQVRAVLDAPLQMERELQTLRTLAGKAGAADLEPALQAAAAAWPADRPPVDSLAFEPGRLTLAASGWSDAQVEQFRQQLLPAGWTVELTQGRLTLSRAAAARTGGPL